MAPPTRLGASEEGTLVPTEPAPRPAARQPDARPAAPRRPAAQPVLPSRAAEDTDAAWGELPEGCDDARYLRDKPPHWQ
ncbi:hypothetical protein [Georgenia sp. Marseille-Q6866]